MKTVGIVLAGGLSRRFGSPKAFAKVGSAYFYERAISALEPHCEKVIVVTRPELIGRFPVEVNVIIDLPAVAGFGPLAGILSAMESVEADRYIVLPCDMPYVDEKIIGKLAGLHDGAVTAVVATGRVHPLVSVWNGELKTALQDALQGGEFRVMNLLDQLDVTWIDEDSLTDNRKSVFVNVNTPNDLERG